MKKAILVHGWDGGPDKNWFPWLRRELEERGFTVVAFQLPEAERPRIEKWIPAIREHAGTLDKDTYLVGHSMGCQAIARYLAACDGEVGGVVYVAGFFDSLTLQNDEEEVVWEEWRNMPIDRAVVRARSPRSIALFSDDDPFVPLENAKRFEQELGSEVVVMHGEGHFTGDRYQAILDAILKLAQS